MARLEVEGWIDRGRLSRFSFSWNWDLDLLYICLALVQALSYKSWWEIESKAAPCVLNLEWETLILEKWYCVASRLQLIRADSDSGRNVPLSLLIVRVPSRAVMRPSECIFPRNFLQANIYFSCWNPTGLNEVRQMFSICRQCTWQSEAKQVGGGQLFTCAFSISRHFNCSQHVKGSVYWALTFWILCCRPQLHYHIYDFCDSKKSILVQHFIDEKTRDPKR